jgi:hypothetical protein
MTDADAVQFTRAHLRQLEQELNTSRQLHTVQHEQIGAQQAIINQQNQALENMATRIETLAAGLAAGGGGAGRYNLKFDTFSFDGPDPQQEFDRFEQNVRMVSGVMRYQVPDVCSAIMGQLRGRAADIGRSLIGTEAEYPDLEAFLQRLRSLFVSPAYAEKARAAFLKRIQNTDESIIAYHGVLKTLWEKAYAGEERQEATLIRQFIAGVRSIRINERLHLDHPANYTAALDQALRLEGLYEVIALEAKRRESNGNGPHLTSRAGTQPAEPMEVGNLGKPRRFPAPNRQGGFRPEFNRPNQSGQRPFSQPNQKQWPAKQAPQLQRHNAKPPVSKEQCFKCHEKGHWQDKCPYQNAQSTGPKPVHKQWNQQKPNANYKKVFLMGEDQQEEYQADSEEEEAKN